MDSCLFTYVFVLSTCDQRQAFSAFNHIISATILCESTRSAQIVPALPLLRIVSFINPPQMNIWWDSSLSNSRQSSGYVLCQYLWVAVHFSSRKDYSPKERKIFVSLTALNKCFTGLFP